MATGDDLLRSTGKQGMASTYLSNVLSRGFTPRCIDANPVSMVRVLGATAQRLRCTVGIAAGLPASILVKEEGT